MTDRYFKKSFTVKTKSTVYMVVYTYNLSLWEAEAGGLKIRGQSKLHSKSLFKRKIKALLYMSL